MFIVHIGKRYCFFVVCTFREAIKNSQVKVDVQKRAMRFRDEQLDNRCLRFMLSSIVIKW
jgi:hypothetical protein